MKARESCQDARDHAARGQRRQQRRRQRGDAVAGLARRAGDLGRRRQHDDVGDRQRSSPPPTARGIPVFTIMPGEPDRGTLFDVGPRLPRARAARRPARRRASCRARTRRRCPIRDVQDLVPRQLVVNTTRARRAEGAVAPARRRARGGNRHWSTTTGDPHAARVRRRRRSAGRGASISIQLNQRAWTSRSRRKACSPASRRRAWSKAATTRRPCRNAQGDMATVSALIDAALGDGADLLVTFSTPTLQAAMQRARQRAHRLHVRRRARSPPAPASDTDHLPERHRRLPAAVVRRDARG